MRSPLKDAVTLLPYQIAIALMLAGVGIGGDYLLPQLRGDRVAAAEANPFEFLGVTETKKGYLELYRIHWSATCLAVSVTAYDVSPTMLQVPCPEQPARPVERR